MVRIWAIGDPHLSFGILNKSMDVFGPKWHEHTAKLKKNWESLIKSEDLVLVPGDISWAMAIDDAKADLNWLDQLPGTKVIIKGNHDYWWGSLGKVKAILPSSIHAIHNNSFNFQDVTVGGTRLWDCAEFNFGAHIDYLPNPKETKEKEKSTEEDEKIFQRELLRLEMSLKTLDPQAKIRIAMTHYPPISADLHDSSVSKILEKFKITHSVFGHLHNVRTGSELFGEKNGVKYFLTSCDYLDFKPIQIY